VAYNFLAVEHEQFYLLPPSLTDWLPEDHLRLGVILLQNAVHAGFAPYAGVDV
jgi:hypothetical protein